MLSRVLSLGPIYIDVNCVNFPAENGLRTEEEIIGREYEVVPGGSAVNFARFGLGLGLETVLGGKIGRDSMGDMAQQLLSEAGVEMSVEVDDEALTNVGLNFVSSNGTSVLASAGSASDRLRAEEVSSIVERHIDSLSHLYLGGCFKLPHLLDAFTDLGKWLRTQQIIFVLDHGRIPRGTSPDVARQMRSLVHEVGIYLPSRDEFVDLWGGGSVEGAAETALRDRVIEDQIIVVKDGSSGAIAFTGEERIAVGAYDVDVRNTVGAGDSFNAGFVAAQALELGFADSVDFACAAAAIKVSSPSLPTRKSVFRLRGGSKPQ
jgi:sugar/nucleoside kinase (ribokinase family)